MSPFLFNFYAEYIMRNPGLDETQAGTEITRRNINNLRYADDMCRKRNYRASFIKKVKEEREKPGLKLNIQKTKIMASGPITSWQIKGGKVETVTDFIFWAPKSLQAVSAAMKVKTLAPWRKSYDQPRQYVKKQRHHFADKGPSSQSYFQ